MEMGGSHRGVGFLLRLCLLLLLLGLGFGNGGRCAAQKLPEQEVEALKGIARNLNKTDWDFSVDPCIGSGTWVNSTGFIVSNVTCDCSFQNNTECHIISLELMRLNLSGVLPEEVVNLTYLRYLDLSRNYIQGPIPASWASLQVFNLSLQGNRISGTVPKELGRMPMLKSLQLEANQLEGPIPPELGNIVSLERFFISANNITGELPSTLSRLTNMTDFRIDGNNISGRLPSFIKNWQRVNRIDMQGTLISGPIPSEIAMLRNLTELRVVDLSGPSMNFPPLQNAQHLTELVLRNCSIYGELPAYQMQFLKVLDLSFNKFSGQIPTEYGGMMALQFLYLTDNMLTGDLPAWMLKNKASNKVNMDVSDNDFTGNPPTECQQANVNMVSSFSDSTDSSLRPCLRKNLPCMGKPQYSSLFINCGGRSVVVDGNVYEDDSSQIGTSTFVLSEDKRWAYSSTGDFVGNENADYIARNTSRLTLAHPELYTEARLSPLSLKYYGLCMENGEYLVNLNFAEIMFTDDHTYSSNGKRVFEVLVQGAKVLKDFNIEDVAGGVNRAITMNFTTNITANTLEIHFYWGGKGTTAIPYRGVYGPLISAISVTQVHRNHHGISTGVLITIIVASCLVIILLLVAFYIKVFQKKNRKGTGRKFLYHGGNTNPSELQARAQYFFSLKEIESATKHFDPESKIGEGGFGPVYKGTLADGTTVAVKKLSSKSSQGNREFLNEIGIISSLRHPNLVRLYGCCIDGEQLLLIYEFLENNSLGRALFGRAERQLKLDWPTRYNICLGTAKGLAYLHEESTLKIVHRDIKPSNILLDEGLQPKISDFGLAKLNDDCGRVSTRIAGTVGYMAPEYATRGCLTRKADVYSFGVVTLEIVSGESNTNSMSSEEYLHLLDLAERLKQQGRLLEIVDQRLCSDYSQQEALTMLNVALLCTNALPTQRPRMSSVVKMLCGQAPIEVTPYDDLNEDWRFNVAQSRQSMNSRTDWSCAPSSDQSILVHSSKDSVNLPSSSSSSLKL